MNDVLAARLRELAQWIDTHPDVAVEYVTCGGVVIAGTLHVFASMQTAVVCSGMEQDKEGHWSATVDDIRLYPKSS